MSSQSRIGAIDILKGLAIIAILFLNILFLNYQPLWISGKETPPAAAILAGILFPSVIFMVGMTIPFAISKRINEGMTGYDIIRQIFARSAILIVVGVLIVNSARVEPGLTGIGKNLWTLLLVAAVFLTWNRYPEKENNFFTTTGLRLTGLAILVVLVFKFRSGSFENNGSLIPGWWELPGLTGWGYLIAGLTYIGLRNSLGGTFAAWAFFLALNILTNLNMTRFLDPLRPYFGILFNGFVPFIILSGQLTAICLKKYPVTEFRKPSLIILISGVIVAASGIILNKYIFNEGSYDNPSWALISCGTTAIVFVIFHWLDEGRKLMNPAMLFKPFGINLFTVYLLQFFFYSLAKLAGMDLFFFLKPGSLFLNIAGSAIWTLLIAGAASLLFRFNIRLKF